MVKLSYVTCYSEQSYCILYLIDCRFHAVKKHFNLELRELKIRDQTPYTAQSIISLLTGLKYFKVKVRNNTVKIC